MVCQLCERDVPTTAHHLIPKHKKKKNNDDKVDLCLPCHNQVHALFDNNELKRSYNTLDKLKANEKVRKWIQWVKKKNPSHVKYSGKELKRRR